MPKVYPRASTFNVTPNEMLFLLNYLANHQELFIQDSSNWELDSTEPLLDSQKKTLADIVSSYKTSNYEAELDAVLGQWKAEIQEEIKAHESEDSDEAEEEEDEEDEEMAKRSSRKIKALSLRQSESDPSIYYIILPSKTMGSFMIHSSKLKQLSVEENKNIKTTFTIKRFCIKRLETGELVLFALANVQGLLLATTNYSQRSSFSATNAESSFLSDLEKIFVNCNIIELPRSQKIARKNYTLYKAYTNDINKLHQELNQVFNRHVRWKNENGKRGTTYFPMMGDTVYSRDQQSMVLDHYHEIKRLFDEQALIQGKKKKVFAEPKWQEGYIFPNATDIYVVNCPKNISITYIHTESETKTFFIKQLLFKISASDIVFVGIITFRARQQTEKEAITYFSCNKYPLNLQGAAQEIFDCFDVTLHDPSGQLRAGAQVNYILKNAGMQAEPVSRVEDFARTVDEIKEGYSAEGKSSNKTGTINFPVIASQAFSNVGDFLTRLGYGPSNPAHPLAAVATSGESQSIISPPPLPPLPPLPPPYLPSQIEMPSLGYTSFPSLPPPSKPDVDLTQAAPSFAVEIDRDIILWKKIADLPVNAQLNEDLLTRTTAAEFSKANKQKIDLKEYCKCFRVYWKNQYSQLTKMPDSYVQRVADLIAVYQQTLAAYNLLLSEDQEISKDSEIWRQWKDDVILELYSRDDICLSSDEIAGYIESAQANISEPNGVEKVEEKLAQLTQWLKARKDDASTATTTTTTTAASSSLFHDSSRRSPSPPYLGLGSNPSSGSSLSPPPFLGKRPGSPLNGLPWKAPKPSNADLPPVASEQTSAYEKALKAYYDTIKVKKLDVQTAHENPDMVEAYNDLLDKAIDHYKFDETDYEKVIESAAEKVINDLENLEGVAVANAMVL